MQQIKLKRKYLRAFKSTHPGGEKAAPRKTRKKLNDAQKKALPPQPKVALVVNGLTGAGVFVRTYA